MIGEEFVHNYYYDLWCCRPSNNVENGNYAFYVYELRCC